MADDGSECVLPEMDRLDINKKTDSEEECEKIEEKKTDHKRKRDGKSDDADDDNTDADDDNTDADSDEKSHSDDTTEAKEESSNLFDGKTVEVPFSVILTDVEPIYEFDQPDYGEGEELLKQFITLVWIEKASIPSDVKDEFNEVEAVESFGEGEVTTPLAILSRSGDHVVAVGELIEPPVLAFLSDGSGPVTLSGLLVKIRVEELLKIRAKANIKDRKDRRMKEWALLNAAKK